MKNLMIYINPLKKFRDEAGSPHKIFKEKAAKLAEIQIENSWNYWDKKDLLLVTNFPYSHDGVEAMVVPDALYCEVHDKASKINTIIYLLERGVLDELTWFHDLDAFQLQPLDISLSKEVGFTDYGWSHKWNTGSIFFKPSSLEVFRWIQDAVYALNTDEERALMSMTRDEAHPINLYYERLNITYNFGMRRMADNYKIVDLPVRVAHFHPRRSGLLEAFTPMMPERLVNLIYEKFDDLHKPEWIHQGICQSGTDSDRQQPRLGMEAG